MVPKTFPPGKITIFLRVIPLLKLALEIVHRRSRTPHLRHEQPLQSRQDFMIPGRRCADTGFLQLSKMSLSMLSQSLQKNAANWGSNVCLFLHCGSMRRCEQKRSWNKNTKTWGERATCQGKSPEAPLLCVCIQQTKRCVALLTPYVGWSFCCKWFTGNPDFTLLVTDKWTEIWALEELPQFHPHVLCQS